MDEDARRRRRAVTRANILSAGCLKHLCRGFTHVFDHRAFIVAESHFDVQNRDAPKIDNVFIQFHVVLESRETLAEPSETDAPRMILPNRFFELRAETWDSFCMLPKRLAGATLESIASNT